MSNHISITDLAKITRELVLDVYKNLIDKIKTSQFEFTLEDKMFILIGLRDLIDIENQAYYEDTDFIQMFYELLNRDITEDIKKAKIKQSSITTENDIDTLQ